MVRSSKEKTSFYLNLTESPHLLDGMLRWLGLLLSRRAERRYQTNMHEAAVLVPNPKRITLTSGRGIITNVTW